MKKYLSFLLGATLVFVLIIGTLFPKIVHAVSPVAGPTDDPTKIGKIDCVYKSASGIFAPPDISQMGVLLGTNKYFYVKEGTTAPSVKNIASGTDTTTHTELPYASGTLTNRMFFKYQNPAGSPIPSSDRNFTLNPFIKIINSENIYTVRSDGGEYYPFNWADLNLANMPVCVGEAKKTNPPSCSDGFKNQDETSVDTGGVCATPGGSTGGSDPTTNFVIKSTCEDGIKNGDETEIDVGGRCDLDKVMISPNGPGTNASLFGHWPSHTRPTRISYINHLAPMYSKWLPRAIRNWNFAGEGAILLDEGGNSPIQIPVTSGNYGDVGWVGVVYAAQGHIGSAPLYLNDYYLKSANYLNDDSQRSFVVIHELGHTFGMDHHNVSFSNANTCSPMDYTLDVDGSRNNQCTNLFPNIDDSGKLKSEYTHTD